MTMRFATLTAAICLAGAAITLADPAPLPPYPDALQTMDSHYVT